MGTIQASFESSREYTKGMIGEAIVRKELQSRGHQIMQFEKGEAHPFDMFCFNKQSARHFVAEVKTKSRMKTRNMTGISERHFKQYCDYIDINNIDFWLFFVDHSEGVIEAGKLQKLRYMTMEKHGESVVWHRLLLSYVRSLTEKEINSIEQVSVAGIDLAPAQHAEARQLYLSLTS